MILAIIGSTATGKTDLALKLAREFNAEILSCDSLLVYRGLDIGTAKPDPKQIEDIKHHGIDLVDLNSKFTAADYVKYSKPILDKITLEKRNLLIVGGTGFYLKALLCGIWDTPPTQPDLRAKLEAEAKEDHLKLYEKLIGLDPEYANKIKANDTYRVIRALEIIEVTKKPLSKTLSSTKLQNPLPYPVKIIGIKRTKMELEKRISARTDEMFTHGIVQETKEMLKIYPESSKAFSSVGYKEVLDFINGKMTLPECRERITISTRQLAKKQMTFFKTFPLPIAWFTLPNDEDACLNSARECLKLKYTT